MKFLTTFSLQKVYKPEDTTIKTPSKIKISNLSENTKTPIIAENTNWRYEYGCIKDASTNSNILTIKKWDIALKVHIIKTKT